MTTRRSIRFGLLLLVFISWPAVARAELNPLQLAPGIYLGPAPYTPAEYQELERLGIRTVIDARLMRRFAREREEQTLRCRGIRYLHIPIDFHPADDRAPHRVLDQLANPAAQPVYMHCQLGRDRSGLVAALYRVHFLGWSPAAAYAAMERQQFNPLLRDLDRYFWQSVFNSGSAASACCSDSQEVERL